MPKKYNFIQKVPALPGIIVTSIIIAGVLIIRALSHTGNSLSIASDKPETVKILAVNPDFTLKTDHFDNLRIGGIELLFQLPLTSEEKERLSALLRTELESMVLNRNCSIETEPLMAGAKADEFGYYVYSEGRLINLTLIQKGLALCSFKDHYTFRDEFFRAELDAREKKAGLWNEYSVLMSALRFSTLPSELQDKLYSTIIPGIGPEKPAEAKESAGGNDTIPWEKAGSYIGKNVTVAGKIVLTKNTGKVCYLNFHPDYSKNFTGVIFASDFPKFPMNPEKHYLNKNVRISGTVKEYKGHPEIIISSPSQIQVIE